VVRVEVPGMDRPLSVPISGITDLLRARSLFYSRQGQQLEQFVYVPNTVVVHPGTFAEAIVPAFQKATTTTGDISGPCDEAEHAAAPHRERNVAQHRELGSDGAPGLLALGGHPGVERDPHPGNSLIMSMSVSPPAGMPSVLAEISFVTNKQEGTLLKTNAYRQQIAEAFRAGLDRLG
jgi:hypothetical protein